MKLPDLDIHTGIQTLIAVLIVAIILLFLNGVRSIRKASKLKFFRMRRDRSMAGWRMVLVSLLLIPVVLILNSFAEPVIYTFVPPTITLTLTPTVTTTLTITTTPTISLTPTITTTPSETDTPTITPTPHIPLAIEARFESVVTPNPGTIFSPLVFAQGLDENYQPIDPSDIFTNPVGHMYAYFTYDQMSMNAQWTALWYRGGELMHFETMPWDGGSGGIGYTDWNPEAYEWLPGEYEVQIFVGLDWKISGRFIVEGEAPTPEPSRTATATASGTATVTATRTPLPTPTVTPSRTPTATASDTPTVTATRTPTPTPTVTPSRTPTNTPGPTTTPTPKPSNTPSRTPTATPLPTMTSTPKPTSTPTMTPTVTLTRTPAPPTPTLRPTITRLPTETVTPTRPTATRAPTYTARP